MPKDFRPTSLERAIGRQLSGWRDELGLSLTEAGRRVGFSSAKLSMMENAVQPSAPVDIMALGYVYKVPITEWQAVMSRTQYADTVRAGRLGDAVSLDVAADFPSLVFEATKLCAFTTDLVPTVLQLADYANVTTETEDPFRSVSNARVRHAWSSRLDSNDSLAVHAIFPEALLRPFIGGPRVMHAQLLHLMVVSEHASATVQVVPRSVGAYPAMGSPFTLLSFPHKQHNDAVFLDSFIRSEYVEDPELTSQCAEHFAAPQQLALSPGESLELIAEAASCAYPASQSSMGTI